MSVLISMIEVFCVDWKVKKLHDDRDELNGEIEEQASELLTDC